MHRTAGNYHCSIRVSVPYMCVLWRWRCVSPRGVSVPGWDSCVRVSVVCLDVVCAVIFRLGASCFLPVVFARCASPSQWVRAWAVGRANPLFGMFIVNTSLYFITYNHRYYHVCEIFFYYPTDLDNFAEMWLKWLFHISIIIPSWSVDAVVRQWR